jgi:hypothetical protein
MMEQDTLKRDYGGPTRRQVIMQLGLLGIVACTGVVTSSPVHAVDQAPTGTMPPVGDIPVDSGPRSPLRLDVRAAGHALDELLAAVSRLTPFTLRASRGVGAEQVAIDFRGGTVGALMTGLAQLLAYTWVREPEPGGDSKTVYTLAAPLRTLALETSLRELPFSEGFATLQRAVQQDGDAAHHQALLRVLTESAARVEGLARSFLSLLSMDQLKPVMQQGVVVIAAGDLAPHQLNALWRYTNERIKLHATSDPEAARPVLEYLTPSNFRQVPVVLRARPTASSGQLSSPVE